MYEDLDYVDIVRETEFDYTPEMYRPYLDPVKFVKDFLLPYHPDYPLIQIQPEQEELLTAIANYNRVAARSGHGVGKTAALAWAVLWFLFIHPDSLVVVTGPKADQIRDTIWTEISRWLVNSPLSSEFQQDAEKLYHRRHKGTWFCVWRTAKEPENIAGFHNKYMLFVVDEASGVKDLILDKMDAMTTAKTAFNKMVMVGNPTQLRGVFFDAFHTRMDMFKTLHFDAEKSALVDQAQIVKMRKKYGENSDFYRYSVKGDFPSGNPEALISLEDTMAAVYRSVVGTGAFELGVDVAHQGNDLSVITARHANKVYPQRVFSKYDTVQLASEVINMVKDMREITGWKGQVRVKIDYGFGHGVIDLLKRDRENKLYIIPVHFGGEHDPRYADAATQMWCEFRDQIKYIELPNEENLIAEVTSRRTVPHPQGLPKIEDKERYKEHFGNSPDRADSIILAFARSVERKRVWGTFSKINPKLCRNFTINWNRMLEYKAQIYGSFWQESDLSTSILLTLWDGMSGHLYIWDELVSLTPRPDTITPRIIMKIATQVVGMGAARIRMDYKKFLWYGNNLMFGITERAHTIQDRDGSANSFMNPEYGIMINPNLYFDLAGTITKVNELFARQAITIHTRCEETVIQAESWVIENSRPTTENTGLCKALCNIVSLLYQWGKFEDRKFKRLKPYSQEKMAARKKVEDQAEKGTATVDKYAEYKKAQAAGRREHGPLTKE